MKRYYKDPQTARRQNEYCERQHYQSMCCEGAMDMLLLVWMLHKTPALPYIELLCQYSKQEIFPLLTDKAHNFMENLSEDINMSKLKGMGRSVVHSSLARRPRPQVSPLLSILQSWSHSLSVENHASMSYLPSRKATMAFQAEIWQWL